MGTVADFLLGFIELNKEIDYGHVFLAILIYFALFWLAVSLWVTKDAIDRGIRRRYAALLGLATFVLSMPFLLLYLLARPHFSEEFEEWHEGGVNVPIVNFVGDKGIEMSFELRVHPRNLSKVQSSDMKIGIEFNENAKHLRVVSADDKVINVNNKSTTKGSDILDSIKNNVQNMLKSIKSIFMKKEEVVKVVAEETEEKDVVDSDDTSDDDVKADTSVSDEEKDKQPSKSKK